MKAEMNFDNIGGGIIAVEGTGTSINGTKTETVSGLTEIKYISWAYDGAPDSYYGVCWKDVNDSVKALAVRNGNAENPPSQGIMTISNNTFDFKWNSAIAYHYVAYGV